MNKIVTTERSGASAVSMSQSGSGSYLQAESLGDVVRFAELMCQSKAGIPSYLHGNAADCMAVTMQALQWSFNPFSVAQKSYKIKDVIAYEAQLIAAVINTRADLKRRPQYEFRGDGPSRQCIVTFEFNDGSVQVYESPKFDKITPKNSPLWKTDPDQQQAYYSIRAGARRYCPEVILGAYDRDEIEDARGPDHARDVTPKPSVAQRLREAAQNATESPASEREGFSASNVQQQTSRVLEGDIVDDDPHDAETGELLDTEASAATPPATDDSDTITSPDVVAEPAGELPHSEPAGSSSEPDMFGKFNFAEGELQHLKDFARKALDDAMDVGLAASIETRIEGMALNYRDAVETTEALSAIDAMQKAIFAVVNRKRSREQAASYIAREILDCPVSDLEGRK